jgi:hypothetical protein
MRARRLVDLLSLWRLRMPADEHQPDKLVCLLSSVLSSTLRPKTQPASLDAARVTASHTR